MRKASDPWGKASHVHGELEGHILAIKLWIAVAGTESPTIFTKAVGELEGTK